MEKGKTEIMSAEHRYIPYKPTPDLVINTLRRTCVLAETETVGKKVIFGTFRVDQTTNEMTPLLFTIDVGSSSEVKFAKNLAEELERSRRLNRNFDERFDHLIEWMGVLG